MIGDQNRNNRLLKKQIMSLNRHLPKERKSLKELLGENKPMYWEQMEQGIVLKEMN